MSQTLRLGLAAVVVAGLALALDASSLANLDARTVSEPAGLTGQTIPEGAKIATFAGGCFWCMEQPFDVLDGVVATISGYTGGKVKNPSYEDVSSGRTGHAESVQVVYDPRKVTYEQLLDVYWHNIDPTTPDRQFCDAGTQYRSAIFYNDEEQKRLAVASKDALVASGRFKTVVTQIEPAGPFYRAEEYHQDYYKKNPIRYAYYRAACGRDHRVEEVWGKATH